MVNKTIFTYGNGCCRKDLNYQSSDSLFKKMKIVFIADSFLLDKSTGINGTQVQMYNLAVAFEKRGHDVHYISLTKDKLKADETIRGIKIHWIHNINRIFSWLKDIKIYLNTLDHIQPDVIYQRGRSHLTFVAAKWTKKNRKRFIWGSNGEDACDFWKRIKRQNKSQRSLWKKIILYPLDYIQDILIHHGVRNADQVINQTEYQKKRLYDNYGKTGNILPSYFLPTEKNYKIQKKKMVLWLANLNKGKQPEIFISLAKKCEKHSDWSFALAGGTDDKEYLEEIKNAAKNIPNLKMIGAVPFEKSNDYYAKASLFVNTSQKEADGLPNAFIQAWLNGTPVLSLNHDPNGWLKEHYIGRCAKGNVQELFLFGGKLLEEIDLLKKMRKESRDFSNKKFTSPKTIDNYLKIFITE